MELKPVAYMIDEVWAVTEEDFDKVGILKQLIKDGRTVPLYAIPEGYALVPIEPTSRMLYASEETQLREFCTSSRQSRQHDIAGQVYAAMIQAAINQEDLT